jgi:hypothetical protein
MALVDRIFRDVTTKILENVLKKIRKKIFKVENNCRKMPAEIFQCRKFLQDDANWIFAM